MKRLKDAAPIQTIERIRSILSELGLLTIEHWNESGIPGIFSVRIVIAGTNIGTNGKGATEALALASGYGEFMERLQNGLLFSSLNREPKSTHFFCREIQKSDLESHSEIVDAVLFAMRSSDENERDGLRNYTDFAKRGDIRNQRLSAWPGLEAFAENSESSIKSAVFLNVITGAKAYLPVRMLCAYGSHGMAAGNTYKEAIVQGLSEIFERYCESRILHERITPPAIPMSVIEAKFPTFAKSKTFVEQHKELRVSLRDCSLGEGFPVYCICITNKKTHRFAVTFGSHPNPEVAMERLFTEVFQGRTVKDISNRICSQPLPEPYNTKSLFKVSLGQFPIEFWNDKASYGFDEKLLSQSFATNDDAFDYCLSLCKMKCFPVFVRDAGYLGFPAVHLIVPGCSEILCCTDFVLNHNQTSHRVEMLLKNYVTASRHEKELLLEFADFDRKIGLLGGGSPYECLHFHIGDTVLAPIAALLLFLVLVAIELQNFEKAEFFSVKLADSVEDDCKDVFAFVRDVCYLQKNGQVDELDVLSLFYEESIVREGRRLLSLRPETMIDHSCLDKITRDLNQVATKIWNKSEDFVSELSSRLDIC